jgi:uncharacterized protein (TIGR02300 family)
MDMSRFGSKHVCPKCGCKFYDLKKAKPLCPKCGTDASEEEKRLQQQLQTGVLAGAPAKPAEADAEAPLSEEESDLDEGIEEEPEEPRHEEDLDEGVEPSSDDDMDILR